MEGTTMADKTDQVLETWEITTDGTIWVDKLDLRDGRYAKTRVGGRAGGSRRLHITTDDRRFNQEQIVEEMKGYDPFVNGALVLVSADRADDIDTTYHLTVEDLGRLLEIKDSDLFETEARDIKSELILRRLKELAETQATVSQLTFLQDLIAERYPIGGTQRTVREMMSAGELAGGEILSGR